MGRWSRLIAGLSVTGLIWACGAPPPKPPVAVETSPAAVSAAACTSVSLSASRQSPVTAGQLVTVTATARGCTHPEYRFVLADPGGTTGSVVQDWSPSSSWTWNSLDTPPGAYSVRADARALGAIGRAPDASAYLGFIVLGGVARIPQTCKLPVSGTLPGSGGFVQMPGGAFISDPASNVALRGQPDLSGLRRGYTYDPVHGAWLPVPRDWVMPDFSSYVYVGTEYPRVSNQPELHLVKLPAGTDTAWPNGEQLYGFPIALRPEGAYGAPGPEIITMVDPAGAVSTVDHGHYGLFSVITPDAIWASASAGYSALTDVQRIDPVTQAATDWFNVSGATALPIGVDQAGEPIIAVGDQLPSGRIAAREIWIAPRPTSGATPSGEMIYSDPAHPLTIIGWPVVSAGAIWIETDKGLYMASGPGSSIALVSSHSGYIAGGCL